MIYPILPFLAGILTGILTGLIPGIHINLIAILILTTITTYNTTTLLIFITSMAVTHTFLDFIPSIFLGAPSEDTAFSILPGHKLLLEGQGHRALKLTLIGSIMAIISLILIVPIFILIIPKIYLFIQRMMAFFLIWILIFLFSNEKKSKTKAIIIFILAGFLGLSSLSLNIKNPLLPLLTGLFGTSTLIHSINLNTTIPKQKIEKLNISKHHLIKPTLATIFISPICSLFPGLGSSQAAVIASELSGKQTQEQFLILLGSINTIVMLISFITLILFQKSRTGIAFTISQITLLSFQHIPIIAITSILSACAAVLLALNLSKIIALNIHKISYKTISLTIIIFLTIIIIYFSGILGLLVLVISTLLGITCIEFETRKSFLMGTILIPTIIYYLPF